MLLADFDTGLKAHEALGLLASRVHLAPPTASEVNLSPDEASNYTYFMPEFNGVRLGDSIVCVDYAT